MYSSKNKFCSIVLRIYLDIRKLLNQRWENAGSGLLPKDGSLFSQGCSDHKLGPHDLEVAVLQAWLLGQDFEEQERLHLVTRQATDKLRRGGGDNQRRRNLIVRTHNS